MNFPINIYLLAFAGATLTTLLSVPLWRAWSYRVGFVDDPGHRKIHDRPIALAGGLAVLTGLLAPLIVGIAVEFAKPSLLESMSWTAAPATAPHHAQTASSLLGYGLNRRGMQLIILIVGALGMGGLGWIDDRLELKPALKFAGQFLVAFLVAVGGVRITLFVPSELFSYFITVFWILTITNAFNFMDNMNGLCSGLGIIGAWFFAMSAAAQGQYLVALIAFLICGALLGFLPFNFPKATVFLGDTGSHVVGFLLSVLAILPHYYTKNNPHAWAVLRPLFVLAIPLLDLAWVTIIRWRAGRPFYIGDTNHLSHRLVRRGLSRTRAVLVIWLLAALAGALSFL